MTVPDRESTTEQHDAPPLPAEPTEASGAAPVEAPRADGTEPQTPRPSSGQAILAQMGGVSGLIYSSLPVLVFVPVSTLFGLAAAVYAALGVALAVLVWRLIRRESIQPAVSGFLGVGISAGIAWVVGASKGYFLLGIWSSLIYAAVFAVSVLIRRPVVGYVWGWVNDRDQRWRSRRRAVYAFDVATVVWVAVFGARFLVQHELYDDDRTGWLGIARIAMGWPLTGVAALATFLAIRAAQREMAAAGQAASAEDSAVQRAGDRTD